MFYRVYFSVNDVTGNGGFQNTTWYLSCCFNEDSVLLWIQIIIIADYSNGYYISSLQNNYIYGKIQMYYRNIT